MVWKAVRFSRFPLHFHPFQAKTGFPVQFSRYSDWNSLMAYSPIGFGCFLLSFFRDTTYIAAQCFLARAKYHTLWCGTRSIHGTTFIIFTFIAQVVNCNFHVVATTMNKLYEMYTSSSCRLPFHIDYIRHTHIHIVEWDEASFAPSCAQAATCSNTNTHSTTSGISAPLNVIISYSFNMTLMNFLAKVLLHHLMQFLLVKSATPYFSSFRSDALLHPAQPPHKRWRIN